MPKLINLIHPYEVNSIKNINDFFTILKNVLRLSSKRMIEKKDGILVPVRWSIKKSCWVVDRGTDMYRDIHGIDKENISQFFDKSEIIYSAIDFTLNEIKNQKLDKLLESYNLKKNENKFFAFEYCNMTTNIIENNKESLYPIGLFQRCQTKKRSGLYSKNQKSILIDNSISTLEKVSSFNNNIFNVKNYKIKNYLEAFKKFFYQVNKKTFIFNLKDGDEKIKVSDILSVNLSKEQSQKEILYFINNSVKFNKDKFNKIKPSVILYLVYFDFVKFIKNYLNINNEMLEGFVVPDYRNNIFYKITGDFMLKVYLKNNNTNKKELLPPILPRIF